MRKKPVKMILPTDTLGGDNPRHEVAGCPTALDSEQAEAAQVEGGGGTPTTGSDSPIPESGKGKKSSSKWVHPKSSV